jgi:hypothetical protein
MPLEGKRRTCPELVVMVKLNVSGIVKADVVVTVALSPKLFPRMRIRPPRVEMPKTDLPVPSKRTGVKIELPVRSSTTSKMVGAA